MIDQVISPWLRIAHFDQKQIHLVAISFLLLNISFVAISFNRTSFKASNWHPYQYFAFIFCLTGAGGAQAMQESLLEAAHNLDAG